MTTLDNTSYSHVRGFNYQPSFGAHELELYGYCYDLDTIRAELERGKALFPGMNTVRLWWSHACYINWPVRTTARYREILDLGPELDIQFIPILFNGWHSLPDFGGQTPNQLRILQGDGLFEKWVEPYLRDVMVANKDHPGILLWDLCNEPYNHGTSDTDQQRWQGFFARVRAVIKQAGVSTPLTIGCVSSGTPELESFCDVIGFHPYYTATGNTPDAFARNVDEHVRHANAQGKALVASETGWGSLDDARRIETLKVELSVLTERNIGFTIHASQHSPVADLHRPDCGPVHAPGYMACIEADGSLRPHHEVINDYF